MIKINLALRKQSVGMASAGSSGKDLFKGFSVDKLDFVKELPLRKMIVVLLAGYAASYALDDYKAGEVKKWEVQVNKLGGERQDLEREIAKTKGYEAIKKSLEEDEKTLRAKLEIVRKLLQGRQTPARILLAIARGIPKDAWLGDLRLSEEEVDLHGQAVDESAMTELMRSMSDSAYFADVKLVDSRHDKQEKTEHEVTTFEISAKRR